ncbi:MAG: PAS domain S-box protein, partial [Thermoanaerobaculia bacterium]
MNEPDERDGARRAPCDPGDAFRVAFENGHEAIFIAQDGLFQVVNPAAERLIGLPGERIAGRPLLSFIHPGDHAVIVERYQRRLAGDASQRSLTVRGVRPDGTVLWIELHSAPITWRERPAVIAFIADVTDREAARRLAAEHEHMLQRIAEVTPQFIFIYDYEAGRDVYINRSVPAALGYGKEEEAHLQPYPFARLCHPDDFARAMERDARWRDVPDGTVDTVEFRLRRASGEWRWFRSLNTPFARDESGRVRQILGVSEDVTEQRRAAEALRRSERLESLGVLAAGLAHDFGNLLTPVLGRAELMLAQLAPGSPLRAHAESIRTAAELAAELVEHLRVFSGKRPVEPQPLDLNAIVAEVVELMRPMVPRDVRVELDLEPRLPRTLGDPTEVRQVVLNLFTNALEAVSDRGGRVALRTAPEELDAARIAALDLADGVERGPAVVLEVEDDGPGMAPEVRARLWEPFFTTKPRGRGLGLPSVHGILRRHRAGLEVASRPGRGGG